MFGSKFAMPALVLAALVFAAVPMAVALDDDEDDMDTELVTVSGEVTAFVYDDEEEDEDDADDMDDDEDEADDEDEDEVESASIMASDYAPGERVRGFVIDNETVVTIGPWWYWMYLGVNITDFLAVGDMVNVTGEWCDEDDMTVLSAWYIGNETTDEDITIKEEGRPPWAGGPKALGIVPWPPDFEDE